MKIYKKGREIKMVDYVKLYANIPDEKWKLIIISLIIGILIFIIFWYIFEKIFEGYNGNPLLALIIGLFSSFLIIVNFYKENDKEYVSYGIESRKKFNENFEKVSDEVKYRTDIPDKDKYINLIFNKFYGNVDISIKDEELLKKLKR